VKKEFLLVIGSVLILMMSVMANAQFQELNGIIYCPTAYPGQIG